MKSLYLVILALGTFPYCYSQSIHEDIVRNVPIVKIVDTSFYSAIDTLLQAENDNGIIRDTNCAIFVNIHKEGLVRITSLKNRQERLPCIPKDVLKETLITVHEGRFVYIFFFGIDVTGWVKEVGPVSPVLICDDEKENDSLIVNDDETEYSCVLVYAMHDKKHITVLGKEIVPHSFLTE